eukprot:scaffold5386_cov98-Isochrysis_galbana.AAC.4
MIGRAPGETVKGGGGKGGNASLPGDSRVSRRIRPLALQAVFFCGGMVSELRALQQPGLEY